MPQLFLGTNVQPTKKKNVKNGKLLPPEIIKKKTKSFDFTEFDPVTGDKVASVGKDDNTTVAKRMAVLHAVADARGRRTSPSNVEETLKDTATGGSIAYLLGRAMNFKDSKRFKFLTGNKKEALFGLSTAGLASILSLRKQKNEYNKQMAARELLANKQTGRAQLYKKMLESKYAPTSTVPAKGM